MHPKKKPSVLALACVALCGVLSAPAQATVDSVNADKVVVNGTPIEASFDKGGLWVTGRSDSGWGIKHVDFATGKIDTYPQSTIHAEGMVEGSDGNMWFASRAGKLGRIAGGSVSYFDLPAGYGRPWHIAAGPDGALWFTVSEYEDIPGAMGAIGRITTGGAITMYPLDQTRNVSKITVGPDGALWATAPNTDEIVRITTQGAISYFPAKVDIGDDAGIVTGADGNLWYTTGMLRHGQTSSVVRMDRSGKVLDVFSGEKVKSPMAVVAGKDGNIWFSSAVRGGTIGRIQMDGQIDELVLPKGRLPMQWGMAHNPVTGDLWTVEPESGALERYPTMGYVVRLAMTGDRALDETADATGNYAASAGKEGAFIVGASFAGPDGNARIDGWSYNAPPDGGHYRWHLRATDDAKSFAMLSRKYGQCMVAGDINFHKPCANVDAQRFEARPTVVAGQFTIFNAALNKCSDFWYGYNYATAHPRGSAYGGHYARGGSYIGMHACHSHYNQRFSFE